MPGRARRRTRSRSARPARPACSRSPSRSPSARRPCCCAATETARAARAAASAAAPRRRAGRRPPPRRRRRPAPRRRAPAGPLWADPADDERAADRGSGAAVSFASPAFLIGLALIPVARRRSTSAPSAARTTFAPANAAAVRRARPRRLAPARGRRRLRRRAGGAARRARQAAGHRRRPDRAGARDDRDRPLRVDAGRRTSRPTGSPRPRRRPARSSTPIPDKVRVGAVAFNQKAEVLQSPTRDHDAVARGAAVGQARRQRPPPATRSRPRSTSITGKAPAAIVLLSDGKSVRGSDPLEAAQEAKERKIPIYTVALGTANGTINGGQPVPPDPQTLAGIAQVTGGTRVHGRRRRRRSTRSTSASARRSRPRSASSRSRASSPAARSR